jgi:hypothetical protein
VVVSHELPLSEEGKSPLPVPAKIFESIDVKDRTYESTGAVVCTHWALSGEEIVPRQEIAKESVIADKRFVDSILSTSEIRRIMYLPCQHPARALSAAGLAGR